MNGRNAKRVSLAVKRALAWAAVSLMTCTCYTAKGQNPASSEVPTVQSAEQTLKGVVLKNKAPVNKTVLNVKLPRSQRVTLTNGLRIVVLEHHKTPTFIMRMVFLTGGLSDPPDYHGLSQFTANLLREGTSIRSSKQIAEQLDSVAATLTGTSGSSSFISFVDATGQAENFDQILEIFTDVIRNPRFPSDEVAKYAARSLSQSEIQKSDPGFLAQQQFVQAVYGNHPASIILPPVESLKKLTAADLVRFHSTYYRPNNAILLVTGDVTLKELLPKFEKMFGDWKSIPVTKSDTPRVPAQSKSRIYLVDRPDSVQTVLQLGNLGIERTHPDYFKLLVMDRIIGGPAGRLFNNLRENKGYTYGAGSYFSASKYPGVWTANSAVRTEVTDGAMHEFMYELKRMRDEKVTPVELENAKRAIVGRFALSLELQQPLLQNIFAEESFGLPDDYWVTYPKKVFAITREDIQQAARKYIDLEHLQIVAVGDASKIYKTLSKYGDVQLIESKQ